MFTRDELDTILAACDATDKLERMTKLLGMNTFLTVRIQILSLQEKCTLMAQKMDEEAAKKRASEAKAVPKDTEETGTNEA